MVGRAAVVIPVRLTPRADQDDIAGTDADGSLRARVRAAPVDGEANVALLHLIAKELRVAPSSVRLVAGATSRSKRVAVDGIREDVVRARWPGLILGPRRERGRG